MIRDSYPDSSDRDRPSLSASPIFVCTAMAGLILFTLWFLGTKAYHFTDLQMAEFLVYFILGIGVPGITVWVLVKRREWKENQRRYPPLVMSPAVDAKHVEKAWGQSAVVLGYDVHGTPWLWPDKVRVMQGIVVGMTGSGKTTLLKNIITQDLTRKIGPAQDRHKIPMVIFDGKGDLDFFYELLPHINRAGRLGDLRLINPARPDLSCLYNPFHTTDENYMAQVNMVFGSFNLHDEFFAKHQLNYLADIVRILHYTGVAFNFYDVIVMALDEEVLREQIEKARRHIQADREVSMQRGLNFEMSVRNLLESFKDRERVPKIQGLLNECMTFLDDELSVITGPYEDLLSIDDVIDQELILFVTLNINKNTEPVRALGKMLLQNLQLVVGKRYESDEQRHRANRPLFSVVLDEFAPFGYRNFSQILQTARGTNTAFLFSMQSLPQLMHVGRGFKEDVTSAPNTTMILRTRDEETARYFLRASAEQRVTRRNMSMQRWKFFGYETYEQTGAAVDVQASETRALDQHIKNLPKGQMEILMTDDSRGTLHAHLHVRPPADRKSTRFEPALFPRLKQSRATSMGSNLRFKSAELMGTRYARRAR